MITKINTEKNSKFGLSGNFVSTDVIKKNMKISNEEILEMCKLGLIKPQKSQDGRIFFSQNDIQLMKRMTRSNNENLDPKSETVKATKNVTSPLKNIKFPKINEHNQGEIVEAAKNNVTAQETNYNAVLSRFDILEKNVQNKIEAILNEKLDGLDEVIVELIRTKTEIENLRVKLNEAELQNHKLTKQLNCFKKVALGFYVKTEPEIIFDAFEAMNLK